MKEIAKICSEKSTNARKAGRECMMFFNSLLIKRRIEEFKEPPIIVESTVAELSNSKASFYIQPIGKFLTIFFK